MAVVEHAGVALPRSPRELLRTKLVAPPPRPGALPRTALVERLAAASVPGRLTLVVAGAGWGKSTLVSSWARARPRTAWFSADPTDADPVRFWGHLLAALDDVAPTTAERAARLLGTPGTSTVHDVVPALLNALARRDEPVALVVDDYHLVGSAEVHAGVGLLLAQLPATLLLVLVSRTEPPLPLARLRGQGRLAELGVDDLRLSPAETAELLAAASAAGTVWGADEVERVHARTEGWVTGLHLAVLSRRSHPRSPARPGAPPPPTGEGRAGPPVGGIRRLAEYLSGEVLDPLPGPLRLLLRRTAVLDHFCADLCAAVTGLPDAAALLAQVERAQLFLVPLDERGGWYRYHHLFADVLHDDLLRAEPDAVPQLHTRAARWYAAHGEPVAAVRHALAGDDRALAADLVATHAPVLTRLGQVETTLSWFRELGDEACRADPRLATGRALTGAHSGRPQEIERWTTVAEQALEGSGLAPAATLGVRIEVAMMRWAAAVFLGAATTGLRSAEEAMRLLAGAGAPPSGFVQLAHGVSLYRAGRLDASAQALARAEGIAEGRGEHLAVVSARGLRALEAVLGRRYEEAAQLAADAGAVARRHGLGEHFNTATHTAAQGWVALEAGRTTRALTHFRRSLNLVRRGGLQVEVAELLTAVAITEDLLGRHDAARRHLAEAVRVLEGCPDPGHLSADPRTTVLTDAGQPPAGPPPVRLSARQTEILRLLADDLTSAEIGERLALSPRTVEAHLRALYRKLDVRTRTAATRYALEHGLVTPGVTRPRMVDGRHPGGWSLGDTT